MPGILTENVISQELTLGGALMCTAASMLLGLCVAAAHMVKNKYNKNFVVTLALLPAIVQVIVMFVNGNIGAGVAVAGAFSLVRFRSAPGNARDLGSIFLAMAMGFITGMGYVFYGFIFLVIICGAQLLLQNTSFGERGGCKTLKIIIPETLDYDGLFDDIFSLYTIGTELDRVRTTDLGSLYELTYRVELKPRASSKAFIDALRCRNGNLNISLGREYVTGEDL
ncbi:MAG: DUF4956 domain-containing protein [Clostridiales bacterium]|jgi:hypothetical protein|nr:DUF4956 domain-containing protein [Clostridiales bacterium]